MRSKAEIETSDGGRQRSRRSGKVTAAEKRIERGKAEDATDIDRRRRSKRRMVGDRDRGGVGR